MISLKQIKFVQNIFYILGRQGLKLIDKVIYFSDKK